MDVAKQNTVVVRRELIGPWLRRSGAAHPRHGTAAGEHQASDQIASWEGARFNWSSGQSEQRGEAATHRSLGEARAATSLKI